MNTPSVRVILELDSASPLIEMIAEHVSHELARRSSPDTPQRADRRSVTVDKLVRHFRNLGCRTFTPREGAEALGLIQPGDDEDDVRDACAQVRDVVYEATGLRAEQNRDSRYGGPRPRCFHVRALERAALLTD